jgi:hypothetical protein
MIDESKIYEWIRKKSINTDFSLKLKMNNKWLPSVKPYGCNLTDEEYAEEVVSNKKFNEYGFGFDESGSEILNDSQKNEISNLKVEIENKKCHEEL